MMASDETLGGYVTAARETLDVEGGGMFRYLFRFAVKGERDTIERRCINLSNGVRKK